MSRQTRLSIQLTSLSTSFGIIFVNTYSKDICYFEIPKEMWRIRELCSEEKQKKLPVGHINQQSEKVKSGGRFCWSFENRKGQELK